MENDPRRNTFSDAINVAQMCTLAIRGPLQKALAIEMPHKYTGKKETQNI